MKKKDLIVTIIFLFFIFVPGISYWIIKDKMDNTNYENRTLNEKPELTINSITDYPKSFEDYYYDHLPYKNEIRKLRSYTLYNLFKLSSTSSVIVGNDGWLFFNGIAINDGNPIEEYRNITKFSLNDKNKIKNSLEKFEKELNSNNIDFYYYLIPNKENVYSEKIEKIISKANNINKLDDFVDYLETETKIKYIYAKDELIESKKNYDTFYKYDTHWNSYGAFVGSNLLIKTISEDYKVPNVEISKNSESGDLAKMLLLSYYLKNGEPIVEYYNNIKSNCSEYDDYVECNSDSPIIDMNLLIIGDSFRDGFNPFLNKVFNKTILIDRNKVSKQIIYNNDIDIVIYESVERYVGDTSIIIDNLY